MKKLSFFKTNRDHNITSAYIGTIETGFYFGRYRLDDKNKYWYYVECFCFQSDVCATPEGCEAWLNNKFAELQKIINETN